MIPFLNEDFLLKTDTAKALYHGHAAKIPILDYHCHLDPKEIYEDVRRPCPGASAIPCTIGATWS